MSKVKRLYVVSIDAMIAEDYDYIKNLPNIGPYVRDASRIVNVRSVYPSLTYTCHASIATGCWPDKHMVNHNEKFMPGVEHPTWFYWRDRYPKVKTVQELAKEHGYTVGSVFWPTTGNLNVDWNINEIWNFYGGPREDYEMMRGSSTKDFLDEIWPVIGPVIKHNGQPEYDMTSNLALCEMIRRKKPEVVFQHVSHLDHVRHVKGVYAPEVYSEGWTFHDKLFGDVLDALRDIGEIENTTIVITSDHGQTPVNRVIAANQLLMRDGFIRTDKDGNLLSWDAFFFSAAHSCHVFLKNPEDKKMAETILAKIKEYAASGELGVERILTKEEAEKEYHVTGEFTYIIEPTDGISFTNRLTGVFEAKADNSDYKYSVATHGHMPEKGPQPTFYLCGPNVKKGVIVENARLIDEAPTIAALLGFDMPDVDGHVIKELL